MTKTAWAIVDETGVNINTIHDTRRGAIVNWLGIAKQRWASHATTDEQIEKLWGELKGDAQAIKVGVSPLPEELN